MAAASAPSAMPVARFRPGVRWAFGNFVIGCGVLAAPATLNTLSLRVGRHRVLPA